MALPRMILLKATASVLKSRTRPAIVPALHRSQWRRNASHGSTPSAGASAGGDPAPSTSPTQQLPSGNGEPGSDDSQEAFTWRSTLFKMFENAMTTLASISVLGLVGLSYMRYYKYSVLRKIEHAFEPGDPVLALVAEAQGTPSLNGGEEIHWIARDEQSKIDAIVNGTDQGRYYLLVGEKGTGKSSMLIEAMQKVDGEGVSMFDAHADIEIFRIRLGRALDFEYQEDSIHSLFSIRGPREASALLDVERAFNKLEKVALKRRKERGKPLVLIINSTHLLRDDDDGKDLLELIQQRAEQWAAGNLCTVVFNSDDYWVYERLKVEGSRLQVLPVRDLTKDRALAALKSYRLKYFREIPGPELLEQVYDSVGGRLAYLSRVAKSKDMLKTCEDICVKEKTWFLNQCWILGQEMDDDVMDQQKYASCAMVLAKALCDKEEDMEKTYDADSGFILPEIPLHEARQIMTRADFIQGYDHVNIFTIDSRAMVRADSVPMQKAFRDVCAQPGFDEHLQKTLDRISAIESLGRTREVTLKDLWDKGVYHVKSQRDPKGNGTSTTMTRPVEEEEGSTEAG